MNSNKKNLRGQQLIDKIHTATKKRGWTLRETAAELKISHVHLTSMTSGARKLTGLKPEKQRALAEFVGISMLDFYLMTGLLRYEDLDI